MTGKAQAVNLVDKSNWVWLETLRIHRNSPETRIASSLSPIEIFVSLYYGKILEFDAKKPQSDVRDRLIISKGHGSICMYPILADLGFFDKSELARVGRRGSFLGGIPDPIIPGYETVNGSLGHGLGVGTGCALALRTIGKSQSVFVLCGDGELHEGANWEAIMFASQYKLDNLNLIVDDNRISMLGKTDQIVSHVDLSLRFQAFGWLVWEADGHNVYALEDKLRDMKATKNSSPKVLIAKTIKGRGIPAIEGQDLCHVMNPTKDWLDSILGGNSDA